MKLIIRSIFVFACICLAFSKYTVGVTGDAGEVKAFAAQRNNSIPDQYVATDVVLANFIGVVTAGGETNPLCGVDSQVMLGDMVYTEAKKLPATAVASFMGRLTKGWEAFRAAVGKWKTSCGNSAGSLAQDNKSRYTKFSLLPGNHIYDVSYVDEAKEMAKTVTNGGRVYAKGANAGADKTELSSSEMWDTPRLEIHAKDVAFLDAQFLPVICSFNYDACFFKAQYPSFPDKAACEAYRDKFVVAVTELAAADAPWKVLRAHHPFMNIEGADQNLQDLWTKTVGTKTIAQHLKDAGVQLVFASHHHSAQFMGFDYGNFKDGKPTKPARAPDSDVTNPQCYLNVPWIKGSDGKVLTCTKDTSISLDTSKKPRYLFTAVIGNSGRTLDFVPGDAGMPAHLLWASKQFGAARAEFDATTAKIKFFTVNGTSIDKTFTVTLNLKDNNTEYATISAKGTTRKRSNKLKKKL